jgi:hypothetical protein
VRRSQQHLVWRGVEQVGRDLDHALAQGVSLASVDLARLHDDDHAFGRGASILASDHGHAATANARDLTDRVFDLMRVDVLAGTSS